MWILVSVLIIYHFFRVVDLNREVAERDGNIKLLRKDLDKQYFNIGKLQATVERLKSLLNVNSLD